MALLEREKLNLRLMPYQIKSIVFIVTMFQHNYRIKRTGRKTSKMILFSGEKRGGNVLYIVEGFDSVHPFYCFSGVAASEVQHSFQVPFSKFCSRWLFVAGTGILYSAC